MKQVSKRDSSSAKTPEPRDTYFEVQAALGITKHMGGFRATEQLADLCQVSQDKYVLVVGCGVGVTPCYLVKKRGCKVVGVDISEEMIRRAKERAKREKAEENIEFRMADARKLPFEDGTFDIVICESVNAFVTERPRAMKEYVRVIRPGGYVGLNEVTWLKEPPPDLVGYLQRVMGGEFLMAEGWRKLLEDSRLQEIVSPVYKTNIVSQWANEVRQFDFVDFFRVWCRFCYQFIKSPVARRYTKDALSLPRSIFQLFEYLGYGLYVGHT